MISQLRPALAMLGAFTLVLGIAYPLAITGIAQVAMPWQANGSLVERNGAVVGSSLIGQSFQRPEYLHPRPSATDPAYDAGASAGSNLGPSSAVLLEQVRGRARALGPEAVPSGMVTSSASGLDPHVTLDAALRQADRIAAARGIPVSDVHAAIAGATSRPAIGIPGAPLVNVLAANLALDAARR
ncbi:potassium-transporting ATPase subunit KdpC [Paracoccus aerius]|uniref:Potassium-transporting ATPase KdpC subunit n=1 Tax=Paracoccus aerius TaxID=1915382 RepID=A0ABS1S9E9_9RHOB|nr:potassium-transporting ATPase subunit KdpC [Paracoccus aerius]MBL3675313.1 potassium-transporting ATPase subunit KdpC [Paracoccus aerius]GHG21028.1 potassium-transporting ATPase KdpC subunit [Paracoccus aerius]